MDAKKHILILLLSLFMQPRVYAQNNSIDSLKKALKNAKNDTTRCNVLNTLIEEESDPAVWFIYNEDLLNISKLNLNKNTGPIEKYTYQKYYAAGINNIGLYHKLKGNVEKAFEFYKKSLLLCKKLDYKEGIGIAYNNLGVLYQDQGDVSLALENFQKNLQIQIQIRNEKGIALALNNIGSIYVFQGDIVKAIDFWEKSLKIQEEIGNKQGVAYSLHNLGVVYQNGDDIDNALKYFNKALKIRESINDKQGLAETLIAIGTLHSSLEEDKLAIEYMEQALSLQKDIGDKLGIANSLNTIGSIYLEMNELSKASENFNNSHSLFNDLNDKAGAAISLKYLAKLNFTQKRYSVAQKYGEKSLRLSLMIGFTTNIKNVSELLSQIYKEEGNYPLALQNFELYIKMRDSINNESVRKATIRSQLKYEYEKQAVADSVAHVNETKLKNAEIEKQNAEIKSKQNQQYALYGGLVLVILFSGFMYNRFKVTQKQKSIIEHQKMEVEKQKQLVDEKQKEILDSIRYAQRIQKAHLPSRSYMANAFHRLKNGDLQ